MYTILFLKGLLIGFSIAMPVGPIGVLCIQHTLTRGRLQGFVAGVGAALADTFYGTLAAFGITVVSDFMAEYEFWIKLIAILFLYFLAFRMLYLKTSAIKAPKTNTSLIKAFTSTFFLTLANPFTILAFGAVYAAFGVSFGQFGTCPSCIIVVGVFCGSITWWLLLSLGAAHIGKHMIKGPTTSVLSHTSGTIILLFAIIATVVLVQELTGITYHSINKLF